MIYVVSSKNAAAIGRALGRADTSGWIAVVAEVPPGRTLSAEDRVYLDTFDLSPGELKKAARLLKKRGSFWGIIDPKGTADDPASFFFEGAYDYIGPGLIKRGLDKKRFEAAAAAKRDRDAVNSRGAPGEADAGGAEKKKPQKLPAGKFPGWKSVLSGTTAPFFFLFVSLSGKKSSLYSLVGEAAFTAVKNRLRETLQQDLRDADALLWIESEDNFLFLVPPMAANGKAAVEAALKILMNSRIISIEMMGLSVSVEFTIALHYGKTVFQTPGKTGAVISESVNYIFHLGTRKAEAGRLTVSEDVSGEALPEGLLDLFDSAGTFEGIPIRHSRRFVY